MRREGPFGAWICLFVGLSGPRRGLDSADRKAGEQGAGWEAAQRPGGARSRAEEPAGEALEAAAAFASGRVHKFRVSCYEVYIQER